MHGMIRYGVFDVLHAGLRIHIQERCHVGKPLLSRRIATWLHYTAVSWQ